MKLGKAFRSAELASHRASPAQINKLVAMLHEAGEVDAPFNPRLGEREYYDDEVIRWITKNMGFTVTELSYLTHRQIGACFRHLESE